jgi:predicted TIM-barrel fold metal-dependent hydrolase
VLVDTHTHVVSHDQDTYPFAPAELPTGAWYLDAAYDVDELLALMDGAGVDRVVLVQPSGAYSFDNRYVADAVAAHPDRCAGVCTIDIDPARVSGADAAAELRRWITGRGLHGVRVFALAFDGGDGWLADRATYPVWDEVRAGGAHPVVTIFGHQLGALDRLLTDLPDLAVSLDHCAFPDLSGGVEAGLAALVALAHHPGLHLKISSHVLESAAAAGADPADPVDVLAGAFGAERLMWGSDFSQTHDRPYAALADLGRHAARRLAPAARDQYLGGTALRLYPTLNR